jgi:hypothetical protein
MPTTSKRAKREFRLLRRHTREVSDQWRAIVGSVVVIAAIWLIGYYGGPFLSKVIHLLPPAVVPWLTRNNLIVISIFLVISLAQYLAWRKVTLANHKLQNERAQEALEAQLDLKFGPSSNLTVARRAELATARFNQLEKEINSGDFSNSWEVIKFKEIFLPILKAYLGGGVSYPEWHTRLVKLVDTVSQFEREKAEEGLE